jgi:hypothetical protein
METSRKYILLLLVVGAIVSGATGSTVLGQERTPSARKVVEYSKCRHGVPGCINEEDEWARLDSVGNDLRADLNLQAYVIAFAARDAFPGSGLRHANYVRNLLRRLVADDTRVRVIDGGRREHLTIEVWLAPFGVLPPAPSSPVLAEAVNNVSAFKFDEFYPSEYREEEALFGEYKYYNQSAVLDGFALLLEREPKLRGHIIAYDGRKDRAGTAHRFARRYWQYLYDTNLLGNNPNVDTNEPSRIVILRGGRRSDRLIELWAVPPGASAPGLNSVVRNRRNEQH